MALTSKQKKQGAVATAAVGALALGGAAVWTLGDVSTPSPSRPIAVAAAPGPGVAPAVPPAASSAVSASSSPTTASSSPAAITVTAKADTAKVDEDTVFTISGEVDGAQPGTKIRLQRQQTSASSRASSAWSTLAYTTFTDKDNKFTLPVKMESAGSYTLRVVHPQDHEGPTTVYSSPFSVTVTGSAAANSSSKTSGTSKGSKTSTTGSSGRNSAGSGTNR